MTTSIETGGNSYYYETLNELENILITACANDIDAMQDIIDYIEIYTKERNEAYKIFIMALKVYDFDKYEGKPNSVDDTSFNESIFDEPSLPKYLQILANEAKVRHKTLCDYYKIIDEKDSNTPEFSN